MNLTTAIQFIQNKGDAIEQGRLAYLLHGERPSSASIDTLLVGQRHDGGFAPFWAPDYSSLDATCYRLAQAEALGVLTDPTVHHALDFLASKQRPDGSWEEEASVADLTPPWVKPGEKNARLYLTANCGYWLAVAGRYQSSALRAAAYLEPNLDEQGRLPGFLHTQWLAGGLWQHLGQTTPAQRAINYLLTRIHVMEASQLAWLIVCLTGSGMDSHDTLIHQAATRLAGLQADDGRWPSEDGAWRDVHATLEAVRALRLCGYVDPAG